MIDTNNSFNKYMPSFAKAQRFLRTLVNVGESLEITTSGTRKKMHYAYGIQKSFRWRYEDNNLSVTYTDGRSENVKEQKQHYFIVWIEGIEPRSGEKIASLSATEHTYTTLMTKALRVKPEDVEEVIQLLKKQHVADWTLNSNSFIKTYYVPKKAPYQKRLIFKSFKNKTIKQEPVRNQLSLL